jgi:hypothetical protein
MSLPPAEWGQFNNGLIPCKQYHDLVQYEYIMNNSEELVDLVHYVQQNLSAEYIMSRSTPDHLCLKMPPDGTRFLIPTVLVSCHTRPNHVVIGSWLACTAGALLLLKGSNASLIWSTKVVSQISMSKTVFIVPSITRQKRSSWLSILWVILMILF